MHQLARWFTGALAAGVLGLIVVAIVEPIWPDIGSVWTLGVASLVGVAIDQLLRAAERRGWIYYRKRRGTYGGLHVTTNFLNMYDPSRRHLQEVVRESEWRRDEDDDGDNPHRRFVNRRTFAVLAAAMAATIGLDAQLASRRGTTIAALRNYAGFYHQQTVSVVGEVSRQGETTFVGTDEGRIRMLIRDLPRETRAEVRGTFLDVGRMPQDDPRLIPFNLLDSVRATYVDRWPRPGEELVLVVANTTEPPPPSSIDTPPLRTLAMDPARFVGQRITVLGQFRGRNLFGELPEAPISDKWSFVLRSSDAAVWVMGVQPKGKTFNFDPGRRIDTGRWVKVTGTARTAKGLTWLEGTTIELAQEPTDTAVEIVLPPPPPPAVEVLFSAPTEGETDVRLDARIRMQLSRDLDESSIKGHVRITYSSSDSADRGEPQPPAVEFTTSYAKDNRALEIRPVGPWERFRRVKVEFLEGVKGTDGGAMAPFTLTFTTGGS